MQDRVPPQNIEAEQSVLGTMLIDNTAAISVTEMLVPEVFCSVKGVKEIT